MHGAHRHLGAALGVDETDVPRLARDFLQRELAGCIPLIRTLKEQIVFGHIHHDIEEVRAAVRAYFERYN